MKVQGGAEMDLMTSRSVIT